MLPGDGKRMFYDSVRNAMPAVGPFSTVDSDFHLPGWGGVGLHLPHPCGVSRG